MIRKASFGAFPPVKEINELLRNSTHKSNDFISNNYAIQRSSSKNTYKPYIKNKACSTSGISINIRPAKINVTYKHKLPFTNPLGIRHINIKKK
jgi:hypothetical protein